MTVNFFADGPNLLNELRDVTDRVFGFMNDAASERSVDPIIEDEIVKLLTAVCELYGILKLRQTDDSVRQALKDVVLDSPERIERFHRTFEPDQTTHNKYSDPALEAGEIASTRADATERPVIFLHPARKGDKFSDASLERASNENGPGIAELLTSLKGDGEAERELLEREAIVALGRWIKSLREERGISQERLAAEAGTTAAQISILESGASKRGVSVGLLARVLFGLGWKFEFSRAT